MFQDLIATTLLFTTPLLVAAVGELIVERAGVVNIGIEGMMLVGALAAWVGNGYGGGAVWGFVAAMLAASVLAVAFIVPTIVFAADQIVSGTGVNLLALGGTALVYKRMGGALAGRPIAAVDPYWMTGVAGVLIAGVWAYLRLTRGGLELTATGESPEAADAAGVPVHRRRVGAVLFGAACAGLAGAYLSTMRVQGFVENMTEGQGFLALAIVIFGRWRPGGIVAAALFFGVVRALASAMETHAAYAGALPLFRILPYAVSLMALAGVGGRSGAPAYLGRAYVRAG